MLLNTNDEVGRNLGLTIPLEQAAATRKSFAELHVGLLIAAAAQRYR
jgi:hypothetical protein